MDMSFMSKFLAVGKDAGERLNRLVTADINPRPNTSPSTGTGPSPSPTHGTASNTGLGSELASGLGLGLGSGQGMELDSKRVGSESGVGLISYCQLLNEDGKMEGDITVSKLGEDRYMVIATDTMHRQVRTWLNRHLVEMKDGQGEMRDGHVYVQDVTGSYAQLNIQGPQSRQLMQVGEVVCPCFSCFTPAFYLFPSCPSPSCPSLPCRPSFLPLVFCPITSLSPLVPVPLFLSALLSATFFLPLSFLPSFFFQSHPCLLSFLPPLYFLSSFDSTISIYTTNLLLLT